MIKQASLESIFTAALEKSTTAERAAFLDEACAGQPEMRERAEALLRANNDAGSFLAHPVSGMEATIAATGNGDTVNNGSHDASLSFLKPCDTPGRLGSLDQYEIIEVVGQGGMGTVLRAFDTKLSRVVAVKVMAPELSANPSAVKRFHREATTAAAVVHDHVVTIHEVETSHRPPYLVMQFVEGQTLQQKIDREGVLELKHILRIGSQMAAGLAAAHKQGLIHRDVKPGNILLENGVERVKITDFGLARAADDMEMTKTGMIAGTPQYMSPEQAKGEPIDSRSDLFSLGSVLYTMCTGRPAFRAETTMGVLRRVCEDAPRPIKEVNPEIPEWLCEIVDKLLEKQSERRFQTATEVADLLGQHLAHHQQPASCPLPARVERHVDVKADSADEAVRKEAKLFRATGILSLVASGLAIAGAIFGLPGFPRLLAIWFFAGGLLSLPVGVLILWAAHQVETRQSREWAVAAGLLSLLPINPFLMFCWPVTIWSLLTIRGASAQGVTCATGPQPAVPPKPSVRSTAEWRHKRSLAIATLIWLAIALPFGVATYYIRQAASRPEVITVYIDDPQVIVTVDGELRPMSSYSGGSPTAWEAGPNWVAFSSLRVRPGRHHVKALKGNQVMYDQIFDLKRGEQKSIHIPGPGGVSVVPLTPPSADGWTKLFNERDLSGWKTLPESPGHWSVQSGVLIGSGRRSYLFSDRDFENFHLRVEARINHGGDSGIHFRTPLQLAWQGRTAEKHLSPAGGYEAELHKNPNHDQKTGSVFGLGSNSDDTLIRPNEWFFMEVIAEGNRFVTKIDGREAVNCIDPQRKFQRGHLALQVFFPGTIVEFRKIEIKELPPADGNWAQLFNRRNLDGLRPYSQASHWQVADGVIVGRSDSVTDYLMTERADFEDFHLRVEAQINRGGNSGVLFRREASTSGDRGGYELELQSPRAKVNGAAGSALTGSLFHFSGPPTVLHNQTQDLIRPDAWFVLEIIARGKHIVTKINGQITADVVDDRHRRGCFEFQVLDKDSVVRLRKIEIKELQPVASQILTAGASTAASK